MGRFAANSRQRVKSRVRECAGLERFVHCIVGFVHLFAPFLQAAGEAGCYV